jgi:RNA-directed DNA polymerase
MKRVNPGTSFERYADDIVVHCKTLFEAESLKNAIEKRLKECHLELNQEKTQIIYCKDDDRGGNFPRYKFDFLGYEFRPRETRNKDGKFFIGFLPAISGKAENAIRQKVRDWSLERRCSMTLEDIAEEANPAIRGWLSYYGKFYKTAMSPLFKWLNRKLAMWAKRKYKQLGSVRRAVNWLERIASKQPTMFVHWQQGMRFASGQ